MVSVFRGVPPIWGLLASCWPLGFLLASCWPLAGLLASCWPLAGLLLASCWPPRLLLASCCPLAGLLLATSFPTKISLENRFFTRLAKLVNSLHENGCFSMVSVVRGVPSIWGLAGLLASCWPLAGLLLASCWPPRLCLPLAGFLLASCWPLAGLLLALSRKFGNPSTSILLTGQATSFPLKIFSRKSVFHKARKISKFSS